MINLENVQKFKSYGFVLTPVIKSKDPYLDKNPKYLISKSLILFEKIIILNII